MIDSGTDPKNDRFIRKGIDYGNILAMSIMTLFCDYRSQSQKIKYPHFLVSGPAYKAWYSRPSIISVVYLFVPKTQQLIFQENRIFPDGSWVLQPKHELSLQSLMQIVNNIFFKLKK
jgi:hypothetical protein